MKKILYILSVVSLLAVACTKEIPVSRNHNLDAESGDIRVEMEMSTLYCNLNDATAETLNNLCGYIAECDADVVTLVAPATVDEENFISWLNTNYPSDSEECAYQTLTALKAGNPLVAAALVKKELEVVNEVLDLRDYQSSILHFVVNEVHFVVTEFADSKNTIPQDWKTQVDGGSSIVYSPNNHTTRQEELAFLFANTINSKEYMSAAKWLWCVNMNAPSSIDITKFNKTFARKDCYNYYESAESAWSWEEFFAYSGMSENLDASDSYFGLNNMMSKKFVDYVLPTNKYYPSNVDGSRTNFLYASTECWNMFDNFGLDTLAADALGVSHYPIMVTLKSEGLADETHN